jgi:hypothetical protein
MNSLFSFTTGTAILSSTGLSCLQSVSM